MWKLKVGEGEGPWLFSTNNFAGRQYWVFDSNAGTEEEREQVEKARIQFHQNRFHVKPSSDTLNHLQNEDGGWELHIEGHSIDSIMLCTALNYVTLRLLGEGTDGGPEGAVYKARRWILDHGGLTVIPSWGKMSLSVEALGCVSWGNETREATRQEYLDEILL